MRTAAGRSKTLRFSFTAIFDVNRLGQRGPTELESIVKLGRRVGLALNPATQAAVLEEVLSDSNLVLRQRLEHAHLYAPRLPPPANTIAVFAPSVCVIRWLYFGAVFTDVESDAALVLCGQGRPIIGHPSSNTLAIRGFRQFAARSIIVPSQT